MVRCEEIVIFLLCALQLLLTSEAQRSPGSTACSNNGKLMGGTCRCFPGYVGDDCSVNENLCRPPGDRSNTPVCSGRGTCYPGGACECAAISRNSARKFTGQFCECNDYSCPFSNGVMCGGADKGACVCGNCLCKDGYVGEDCSCSTSDETCTDSKGAICNYKGTCECGKCMCTRPYYGPTCEDTFNKQTTCRKHKNCVQCRVYSTGPKSRNDCRKDCSDMNLMIVDKIPEAKAYEALCEFTDDDDCLFQFMVMLKQRNEVSVKAQKTKVCPNPNKGSRDTVYSVQTTVTVTMCASLLLVLGL